MGSRNQLGLWRPTLCVKEFPDTNSHLNRNSIPKNASHYFFRVCMVGDHLLQAKAFMTENQTLDQLCDLCSPT